MKHHAHGLVEAVALLNVEGAQLLGVGEWQAAVYPNISHQVAPPAALLAQGDAV